MTGASPRNHASMRHIVPSTSPIFFLLTRDGYACGWCELDEDSEWLTLIPHPLSPVPARRWKYRTEIENVGRVVAVSVPLAE
jgi:hypothetical protein